MAIPRRFDRRPPERDSTRTNGAIRAREVRLIGDDGSQVGIVPVDEALRYAQERDLDLVEVSAESSPPVCRVLDYSKYKYEQAIKAKASRKHQQQITIREIKLRPKIAIHDYTTKRGHVERFLRHHDKVKVTIMFRGREMVHPERGAMLLQRLAEDVAELGTIEQHPLQDGRNMTMVLGPTKIAPPTTASSPGKGRSRTPEREDARTAPATADQVSPPITAAAHEPDKGAADAPPPTDDAPKPQAATKADQADPETRPPDPQPEAEPENVTPDPPLDADAEPEPEAVRRTPAVRRVAARAKTATTKAKTAATRKRPASSEASGETKPAKPARAKKTAATNGAAKPARVTAAAKSRATIPPARAKEPAKQPAKKATTARGSSTAK